MEESALQIVYLCAAPQQRDRESFEENQRWAPTPLCHNRKQQNAVQNAMQNNMELKYVPIYSNSVCAQSQ